MTSTNAKCGTHSGWIRHKRHNEPPCMRCRIARNQYLQDWRLAPQRRQVLLEALAGFDRYPTGRRTGAA